MLEVDYSIVCTDASFLPMTVLAWILVVLVPVSLLVLLGRRSTQETADPDGHLRAMYGFCVDDYRPGCWYYEVRARRSSSSPRIPDPRLLAAAGHAAEAGADGAAPVRAARHSNAGLLRLCAGVRLVGLQLRLLPYREPDANVLKTLVDGQLFLSFLLRVLPRFQLTTYEPPGAEF